VSNKPKESFGYEAGRNDGWEHALDNQLYGPQQGSLDTVTGSHGYTQGYADGVELYNNNFDPSGRRL
jgi:hypothetical protein